MIGYVLVDPVDKSESLYVPDAGVHMYPVQAKPGNEWVVCVFEIGGYLALIAGRLKQRCSTAARLDVPQHIIDFAVEHAHLRQASVGNFDAEFLKAVETEEWDRVEANLIALLISQKSERDAETQNRIGEEIHELIRKAGGLS